MLSNVLTCNRRKSVVDFLDAVVAFYRAHRKTHHRILRRRNNNNRFVDVVGGRASLKVVQAVELLELRNHHHR